MVFEKETDLFSLLLFDTLLFGQLARDTLDKGTSHCYIWSAQSGKEESFERGTLGIEKPVCR